MIDREKIIPYFMAGLVVALVAFLVGIDVVASLPGAPPSPVPQPTEKRPEAVLPLPRTQAQNPPKDEVQNMVLFTEVSFKDTKVTTGRRFRTPQDKEPSEQWCYILRSVRGHGARQRVELGEKQGAAPVRWFSLMPQAAADIGYALSDLEDARGKCRFTQSAPEKP